MMIKSSCLVLVMHEIIHQLIMLMVMLMLMAMIEIYWSMAISTLLMMSRSMSLTWILHLIRCYSQHLIWCQTWLCVMCSLLQETGRVYISRLTMLSYNNRLIHMTKETPSLNTGSPYSAPQQITFLNFCTSSKKTTFFCPLSRTHPWKNVRSNDFLCYYQNGSIHSGWKTGKSMGVHVLCVFVTAIKCWKISSIPQNYAQSLSSDCTLPMAKTG